MAHHTKDKGDLDVAKAHADLVAQGFLVLFPTTEHAVGIHATEQRRSREQLSLLTDASEQHTVEGS